MKKLLCIALMVSFNASAKYIEAHHPHVMQPFSSTCIINATPTPPENSDIFNPNGYYNAALEKTGDELKHALNTIVSAGHIRLQYTDNSNLQTPDVWRALMITDEDPYNSDNVILLYTGRSQSKEQRTGQGSLGQDNWNREHVWPRSKGGWSRSSYADTDIHHLRPADEGMNNERGNFEFYEGGVATSESPAVGNKKDTSKQTFEPRDEVKGDIARMMFYMATRYQGNDNDGLKLDLLPGYSTPTTKLGDLCTLLRWHQQDPVDEFERNRHEKIYDIQNNRNPFIDNPSWVDEIFYQSDCR
ncbi:endonuclease I family protein [Vibrio metschnikovii]|uniref:endonuclease I family protein n=1 Tax=Vibrio metschnikovii TaxID=28172 RepID=UPI001C2FE2E7|nr:endonuclease [Vibrio metschnikovii]MDA3139734.1 endonuclease [Vibrio metschnikovii]